MQDLMRCLRDAQACQRPPVARVPRLRAQDSTMLQQAIGRAPHDCDRRVPRPARAATRKEQPCSRRSQAEAQVGSNVEVSGGLKRAQRALGCPLDWQVRRSRVGRQGQPGTKAWLEATPARTPLGDRAVCQRAPVLHYQKAPLQQRAHVLPLASAVEGAPLVGRAQPKTTNTLSSDSTRRLTFDMSGGFGLAQRSWLDDVRSMEGLGATLLSLHIGDATDFGADDGCDGCSL